MWQFPSHSCRHTASLTHCTMWELLLWLLLTTTCSVYHFCIWVAVFLFFCFLEPHPWSTEVPRLGVKLELQLPAYASHSNAGSDPPLQPTLQLRATLDSPIRWARPGIKPASSWILVGFVSIAPQWELPFKFFKDISTILIVFLLFRFFKGLLTVFVYFRGFFLFDKKRIWKTSTV